MRSRIPLSAGPFSRLKTEEPEILRSPVLFCAFNLEELNMIGSTHFAKKLKAAGAKVNAMISLEMVGYTDNRPGSQKYPIGLRWFYPACGVFTVIWLGYVLARLGPNRVTRHGQLFSGPFE